MSDLYGRHHRDLQDQFETRALADRLEAVTVHDHITEEEQVFIESRDMFILSTVDERGMPSVSYKGGDPGFVRVVDTRTLAFPLYDGNGMFFSAGNISANGKVGLLFIDFEQPHRIRVHGEAGVHRDDPLAEALPGAELIVRIAVTELFVNCPRYVHRYDKVEASRFVPRPGSPAPLPDWKRIDMLQDVLSKGDRDRAEAAGVITLQEYAELQNDAAANSTTSGARR